MIEKEIKRSSSRLCYSPIRLRGIIKQYQQSNCLLATRLQTVDVYRDETQLSTYVQTITADDSCQLFVDEGSDRWQSIFIPIDDFVGDRHRKTTSCVRQMFTSLIASHQQWLLPRNLLPSSSDTICGHCAARTWSGKNQVRLWFLSHAVPLMSRSRVGLADGFLDRGTQ